MAISILNPSFSHAQEVLTRIDILRDKDIPVQWSADISIIDEKNALYTLEGNVVFTKGDQTLSGNKAIYNWDTDFVEISGNVILKSGSDILRGEKGTFNLKDQTGKIDNGRIFISKNHYHISGDVMEKVAEDTYIIKNCRLTTCDGENPAWNITGSEVKITIDDSGHVKNAAFRIFKLPLIYVPYLPFPVNTDRKTGLLLPMIGYSEMNGSGIELPFFWAISEQTDATFYERYMEKRGLMQGLEFRYLTEDKSRGDFLFDILSDRIETKDMSDVDQLELSPYNRTNTTRYWLRSRTDQQLPNGVEARLDTDYVSDQDYFNEFSNNLFGFEQRPDLQEEYGRPIEEIQSPTRRSALRLSRFNRDFSLQAASAYHQRPEDPDNDSTAQPLVGLDFSMLPQPLLKQPLYFAMDTDYDYIWRDFGQKGHSLSFNPKASYPLFPGRYMKVNTYAGFTGDMQWLDQEADNKKRQTRYAYNIGGSLSSSIEKVFDFRWKDVTKLKHTITPSLSYDYRSHKDEDTYQPWFEGMDDQGSYNRMTLSVKNYLKVREENKDGKISYRRLGYFHLSQEWDIEGENRDEDLFIKKTPLEPLTGELSFTPLPGVGVEAEAKWDHYDDDFTYADVSLNYKFNRAGNKADRYNIDYEYSKDGNTTLNFGLDINLIKGFTGGASLKRNIDEDENIVEAYRLEYNSQCWGVRLTSEERSGESRYMISFSLLGLRDRYAYTLR